VKELLAYVAMYTTVADGSIRTPCPFLAQLGLNVSGGGGITKEAHSSSDVSG
jgi:hypothetical protein